jgi:hypothetical protein
MTIRKTLLATAAILAFATPSLAGDKEVLLEVFAETLATAKAVQLHCPELHPNPAIIQSAMRLGGPNFFKQYDIEARVRRINLNFEKTFEQEYRYEKFTCSEAWEEYGARAITPSLQTVVK